ncbi:MAG: GntR family transcriptional regulator [Pseudomonadota bacterium]
MDSVDKTPTHERLYRLLRSKLMYGEMAPGQAVTIRDIADTYDTSMTPAREAVRRLSAEGALRISPTGRVTTVALGKDRIEELADIRSLLETDLATRALPRAHASLIERLEQLNMRVDQAVRGDDPSQYIRANLDFHRSLYLRAQAPATLGLVETVWLQLGPTMAEMYTKLRRPSVSLQHTKVIEALKAGDEPSLRLAIRSDVTQGLRILTRS